MTSWLVPAVVRMRLLVVGLAVAALAVGLLALRDAPVAALPEYAPPRVQVQTEALGLSAPEVENLVTVPLEQDLLNGVPWVRSIASRSMEGLSTVDITFEPGTDLYDARQMVQERMTQAKALPNVGTPPVVVQPEASDPRVAAIGLTSDRLSLVELSTLARWQVRPRLMGIDGVANVSIWGQRDRQLQVQLDPARMRARHVAVSDVVATAGNALWVSPLTFIEANTPGTGGFIETPNQRLPVQHVLPITTAATLAGVPVQDVPGVTLGDIATVTESHQPLVGDAVVAGRPGLLLAIDVFPGADVQTVTAAVDDAMAAMAPGLPGVTVDAEVYRPASYLATAVHDLGLALLAGLLLLLAVAWLFLGSWRTLLVSLTALLVSLVVAAGVLQWAGTTFTLPTLLGFAVALGAVVDDALRDPVRLNRWLARRADRTTTGVEDALTAGSRGVRRPMLFATLVGLVAAVPLLVVGLPARALTTAGVVTYAVALVSSLVVAAVVTPALAATVLPAVGRDREGPLGRLTASARARLAARPGGRAATVVAALLVVAGTVGLVLSPRGLPLPSTGGDLQVAWTAPPGVSVPRMDSLLATAESGIRAVAGVDDVASEVGRATTGDVVEDVSSARTWVRLDAGADQDAARAAVATAVAAAGAAGGLQGRLVDGPASRLAAASTGTGHDLVVRVFGSDLGVLEQQADRVAAALGGVPGVSNVLREHPVLVPTLTVRVDLLAAQRYGLSPGDVRRQTSTAVSAVTVGNIYDESRNFDVVVNGGTVPATDLSALPRLPIDTPAGGQVPLSRVAEVRVQDEPAQIDRNSVSRSLDVMADVAGDPGAVVADVNARLAPLSLPEEYHLAVLSDAVTARGDLVRVAAVTLGAVVLVVLLLQAATDSWRRAAAALAATLLAVAGGLAAAPLVGGLDSWGAVAGVATGALVALRAAVARASTTPGPEARPDDDAVASVRTATVLLAALLPAAVAGGAVGAAVLRPLAAVLAGALVAHVAVDWWVLPVLLGRRSDAAVPDTAVPEVLVAPTAQDPP